MLEFCYDFLDRYFDLRDFELIQMDIDNNMAISGESPDNIVRPELKNEFDTKKDRVAGLEKVERSY